MSQAAYDVPDECWIVDLLYSHKGQFRWRERKTYTTQDGFVAGLNKAFARRNTKQEYWDAVAPGDHQFTVYWYRFMRNPGDMG